MIIPNQCPVKYKLSYGICSIFLASEPLSGKRLVKVTPRRTKKDWAFFLKDIAALYPSIKKIILVLDNLNTHTPSSLYETFAPKDAKELWDHFEFVYTPKHGSWLNMAEIELNVLLNYLNRRIDSIEEVQREVTAWQKYRNNKNAKINWQFTTEDAKIKLLRLYPTFEA